MNLKKKIKELDKVEKIILLIAVFFYIFFIISSVIIYFFMDESLILIIGLIGTILYSIFIVIISIKRFKN